MASANERDDTNKMFGPLTFDNICKSSSLETKCLLCDDSFNLKISLALFLRHIFDLHNVVIEDVQNIAYLHEYLCYWREKFKTIPMNQIIPSVSIDSTSKYYFLLSTLLKEDKELRHKLKLKHTLKVQEFERTDMNYIRPCLLCKVNFEGSRPNFLDHLSSQHNLQLGNPQNLVFIEELVDKIEAKLKELKCIYCEKSFPERNILKEHMRKKLHKRINPQNKEYDRFYIVNYLEVDKNWQAIQKEDDKYAVPRESEANSDEEYSDWHEQEDAITCLLCESKESNINLLCLHMEADHDFDFYEISKPLDFYQRVKLVNYIRRQYHTFKCIFCNLSCGNVQSLLRHLSDEKHYQVPDVKTFDQPEFYFPTYENDAFLYFLDDLED